MSFKLFSLALLVVLLSVKMAKSLPQEALAQAVDEIAEAVGQADEGGEAVDQAVNQADEEEEEEEEEELNPTITPQDPFKPRWDAKALYKAMHGSGTTESTIVNVLTHRTYEQRNEIAKVFEQMYGYNFRTWLFSEISSTFREIIKDLMYLPIGVMVDHLDFAMQASDTDQQTLIDILVPLNEEDFSHLESLFEYKFGGKLRNHVSDHTEGLFGELLTMLIDERRPEDEEVDEEEAKQDAEELHDGLQNDMKVVFTILTQRSWAHLKATFDFYSENYGEDSFYGDVVKYTPRGDWRKTILAIYQYALDTDLFFAQALHRDLYRINNHAWGYAHGVGRVFAWRSEIDLGNIAQAFENEYSEPLVNYVKDYARGYAKDALVGILV